MKWLIALSCVASFAAAARAAGSQLIVHPEDFLGPPIVGFGAQINPYLYCRPNWGDVTETNVRDYEAKVIALAPQHVRIFCLLEWFKPPATEPISKGDPRVRESFVRTVALAQRAGATVNITLWYGKFSVRKKNEPPAPGLFEKTVREFVAILRELIVQRKLAAVRFATIQNEVNGEGHDGRHFKMDPEEYSQIYHLLDQELRKANLRERIQIVSGDLVAREQEFWIPFLGKNLSDVSDGYSMHAYWDYWDEDKLLRRVSSTANLFAALPPNQQKPLFAMEFGVRGQKFAEKKNDPGDFEDGQPIATKPLHAAQIARFMMEAINRGYVATVQWDMVDAHYDHFMRYGVIGDVKSGWALKPAYHVLRLFTHTIRPGWRAVKIDGGGDDDLTVSALRGPGSEYTVLGLNHLAEPKSLTLAGLPANTAFNLAVWNGDGAGKLTAGAAIRSDAAGAITMTIPADGLAAATTLKLEEK